MGFGYSAANIQRERNLAGGIAPEEALFIFRPDEIAGPSVTVGWNQGSEVADNFEVCIGVESGGNSIARSGPLVGGGKSEHNYTFDDLTYTTAFAWITVKYRFGTTGDYQTVSKRVPVTVEPVFQNPVADLNWDDSRIWDDNDVWRE